uniref:Uncharacterized protein n=1 Tax=viral metagenome TaxID=1070528 RepID=A0A6C0B706_9ZZZZ
MKKTIKVRSQKRRTLRNKTTIKRGGGNKHLEKYLNTLKNFTESKNKKENIKMNISIYKVLLKPSTPKSKSRSRSRSRSRSKSPSTPDDLDFALDNILRKNKITELYDQHDLDTEKGVADSAYQMAHLLSTEKLNELLSMKD